MASCSRGGRTAPASPPGRAGHRVTPCHPWGTRGCPQGGTLLSPEPPRAVPAAAGGVDVPCHLCQPGCGIIEYEPGTGSCQPEPGLQTNPGALQGNAGTGSPPAGNRVFHLPRRSSRSGEASAVKRPFFKFFFCFFSCCCGSVQAK